MCKCTPNIRTPFCGKSGCEWPTSEPKRLTLESDEHMRWIYDPYHRDYHTEYAKDLRTRRWAALNAVPAWMIEEDGS